MPYRGSGSLVEHVAGDLPAARSTSENEELPVHVGEMSWALEGDMKALAEFEAQLNLNRVWERHACTGLCQFDVRRFTPETLREMIIVHPLVVIGDRVCRNPYYVPPEQYLSPDWPAHEADWMMTNLERLQQSQDSLRESQERYRSLSRRLMEQQEHERAELAGGRLYIESAPAAGTTVRARFTPPSQKDVSETDQ